MARIKIGWHTLPVGVGVPKSFWQALDNVGIPAVAKGADTMSGVFDLQEIAKTSSVPHVCVWRKSNSTSGGYQYDTPNYGLPANQAAQIHWTETKKVIPPELDKSITWIEVINEVDKNLSDWLGNFSCEIALLANADGYKILSLGWSGGEPEPEHWFTPGMQKYLDYCSVNQDRAGISVHEYTFDINKTFEQAYPYLIGRFEDIHDACSGAYPTIFVSEFGYALNDIPQDWAKLSEFLYKSGELYAKYPNVLGAAIWVLGTDGWGNLGKKWEQYMPQIQNLILSTTYPDPVTPEPEPEPEPVPEVEDSVISVTVEHERTTILDGNVKSFSYRFDDEQWTMINAPATVSRLEIKDTTSTVAELTIVDGGEVDAPVPPPVTTLKRGDLIIDVSHWNGTINWEAYKNKGVKGAIIRASNGIIKNGTSTDADGVDRQYWRNVNECTRLGIPFGVYHFLNGNYPAVQQVLHFTGIIRRTIAEIAPGGVFGLSVALDAEPASVGGTPANEQYLIDAGNALLSELDTLNMRSMATWYSRASWWNTVVPAIATWPRQFRAWVAQWPSGNPISTPPSINTSITLMNGFAKNDFWQFTSQGEDIFAVNDKTSLDVNYYLGTETAPPPPPPVSKIDLLPFFKGDTTLNGPLYEVETRINGSGVGQQRHQTQVLGNKFYFTKGGDGTNKTAQWEELSWDELYIRRYRDSSMSESQFYTLLDGTQFSKWCPRFMAIDETFQRNPLVAVYNKSDCSVVASTPNVTSWIKLEKVHPTLTCYNGIVINDVVELHWYNNLSQPPVEIYYFSADPRIQGLAGWKHDNKVALVSEIHGAGQRPDSVRETICL